MREVVSLAWVSAHEGMRDHPKTRALARKLQCSRHESDWNTRYALDMGP